MILGKFDLGKEIKLVCKDCNGTGLARNYIRNKDHLAGICDKCIGKGYVVYIDTENKTIRRHKNNDIICYIKDNDKGKEEKVELFQKLNVLDNIDYVIFINSNIYSLEALRNYGANEINIIRYSEFLDGMIPLPCMTVYCPKEFSRIYGQGGFDEVCRIPEVLDCGNAKKRNCWDVYYGNAKTIKERQAILKLGR